MSRWKDDNELRHWLYKEVDHLEEEYFKDNLLVTAHLLLRYVASVATFSHRNLLLDHGVMNHRELLDAALDYQGGLWCGGVADMFAGIVNAFPGLYAAKWSYGMRQENITHVTTIVGTSAGDAYCMDAYLGYVYLDAGNKRLLPFSEVVYHVRRGEYDRIDRQDIPIQRPAVGTADDSPGSFNWLFDGNVPMPRTIGDKLVYDGARPSFDALYRWGGANRTRIERARGNKPFDAFMWDLIIEDGHLSRFTPGVSESSGEWNIMRQILNTAVRR
jgi:hypothetical protein